MTPDKPRKPIQMGPEEGGRVSEDLERTGKSGERPKARHEGEPRERESKSTAGTSNSHGKARTR